MGRSWTTPWRRCVSAAVGCCVALAIAGAPALAITWPPQVSVAFDFPPSPLIQGGTAHLVYEILLTNFARVPYVLESIDVKAGVQRFAFAGAVLTSMMRIIGVNGAPALTRRLEAGRTAIVYVTLDFNTTSVPSAALVHTLHLTSSEMGRQALSPEPLAVTQRAPVVVAPPLRGPNWIAGDASHNGPDADHRRTAFLEGGHVWLAQRYAIDWVQYRTINGVQMTWSGPENKNGSYFCYNAPIYSVATGKVIEVMDGIPENVPHGHKLAIDINLSNVGGNHVVVDIGNHRYAFYAHMRPGSVQVRVGDYVSTGHVLGRVGNTGNSTEPHLHMHIVDGPSFLAANGLPYAFVRFTESPSVAMITKPDSQAMTFGRIGPLQPVRDEYPVSNAAVIFP